MFIEYRCPQYPQAPAGRHVYHAYGCVVRDQRHISALQMIRRLICVIPPQRGGMSIEYEIHPILCKPQRGDMYMDAWLSSMRIKNVFRD